MRERRKYIRIPNVSQIKYELFGSPKVYSSVLCNISPEGLSFMVHDFISVGTKLKVTFAYGDYFYGGSAKVIWCRKEDDIKYRVGAKFIGEPKLPDNLIGLEDINWLKSAIKRSGI
jgi:hypothetical protein